MAVYEYTARRVGGARHAGAVEADSRAAAAEKLRQSGWYVTSLRDQAEGGRAAAPGFARHTGRVGLKELAVASQQFATMVNAGLPLLRTLAVLEEQTGRGALKTVLGQVRADVERGAALSEALSKHPAAFSRLYVNMVRAGETSGVLAEVLFRLAGFLEKDLALRQKVKAATTYPVLLAFAALAALLFMTVVIVPQFATFFRELGGNAALPVPTQLAIALSSLIQGYWWAGVAVVLGGVWAGRRYIRTAAGSVWYDRARLAVPVFGLLHRKLVMARLSRTLGTLVGCGVPVMRALEIAGAAAGNIIVGRALDAVRASVREGESVAGQLAATHMFSSMVVQMVRVGEETGALPEILAKIADFYDAEVETAVATLASAVEPALIIGMGAVIGSLLLALYLPIFSLATAVR